jgi:curli production assembly/transport component CsgG
MDKALVMLLFLAGCVAPMQVTEPELMPSQAQSMFEMIEEIDGQPLIVAVYSYMDKTGQRKPSENVAHLSTAITQGAEAWLIKAMQDIGKGKWFRVVERVGLDNLIKERQLIRTAREAFEGERAKELRPLLFAGLIAEGGVISYDTNISSGGVGARYLGIGASTQYRQDIVTVFLRLVSVQTGEVLTSVAVQKTILSVKTSVDVLKFVDMGTKAFEVETGLAVNEPTNYAVKAAIEQSVIETIMEGERKGFWKRKEGNK